MIRRSRKTFVAVVSDVVLFVSEEEDGCYAGVRVTARSVERAAAGAFMRGETRRLGEKDRSATLCNMAGSNGGEQCGYVEMASSGLEVQCIWIGDDWCLCQQQASSSCA